MAIIKTKFNRGVEGATNIVDSGTEGTKVASGTTAERGSTAGQIRFNTTTNLAEYYTGTEFKAIDAPPVITSIDDGDIDSAGGGNQTIVITGSNFSNSVTVLLIANSGSDITPSTVTRNSATQITITHAKNQFVNANEPYDVKVINENGLSAVLFDAINVDNEPAWQTPAGALSGSPFSEGDTLNVTLSATDPDGDTVTYSLQSGALPSGISLNSSTGVLSGTLPDESSNVTYNFTIRATANSKTTDRSFSLVNNNDIAPTWTTSAGSLGTIIENISASLSATASDADGDTIVYSVNSGSLPSGLSLNSSTGAITGTPSAVSADTTSNFDLRATANGQTVDRSFSIITKNNTITNNLGGGTNYAYYPMSGNANDASGNGRNATANSVTFTDTNQVGQAFGNCMSGGGYLQLPFTRGSGSQFAFAVWFRTTSSADQYFVGDVGGAYNIAFSLHMTSSTNIQAVVDGSGGPTYSTNWTTTPATTSLSDGNWHHLFLKQNGNAWRLYIDNYDLGYNSSTMIQRNGVNNLQLGAYGTGTRFQGQLDNARFFDFSPGVTDGTNLYNAENNMKGI